MQQQHVPRETFIALRARRQAFRVATDFLYRDVATDDPRAPLRPLAYVKRRERLFPPWVSWGAIVVVTTMALCVITCVAIAIAQGLIQIPKLR